MPSYQVCITLPGRRFASYSATFEYDIAGSRRVDILECLITCFPRDIIQSMTSIVLVGGVGAQLKTTYVILLGNPECAAFRTKWLEQNNDQEMSD